MCGKFTKKYFLHFLEEIINFFFQWKKNNVYLFLENKKIEKYFRQLI